MDSKSICQWALLIRVAIGFFMMVYFDFNGRTARKPLGFSGFVATVIATACIAWVYMQSGAWSEIFGSEEN